ncbi:MAG: Kazal-type serine protease inhibitor domain-containing protein [Bacteroidia bacterium]|jgi:hypothetical protein
MIAGISNNPGIKPSPFTHNFWFSMRAGLILLVVFIPVTSLRAQDCVNQALVNSTYFCPNPEFYPVCGCDGKTYRNLCEAQMRNGIQYYTDGPCTGFEFDILPNITATYLEFTLVQSVNPSFVKMIIMDAWGKFLVIENVSITPRFYRSIDVSWLMQGVYFILVYDSNDNYRFRRFVKYNP